MLNLLSRGKLLISHHTIPILPKEDSKTITIKNNNTCCCFLLMLFIINIFFVAKNMIPTTKHTTAAYHAPV